MEWRVDGERSHAMTRADPRILVATEVVVDAGLVKRLLSEEFENVTTSTDPDRSVQDFEHCRPDVLILAFNTLEKAERYYLGLYRLSTHVHALPHRTLILCNKDDLRHVYALCKKEYFDDYILFWPMTHDTPRLRMAVHHAMRQMAQSASERPDTREMASQARRIAELESLLEQHSRRGKLHVEDASRSLQRVGKEIGEALDGFSRSLTDGSRPDMVEVKDRTAFLREFNHLKTEEVDRRIASAKAAVEPVREWMGALRDELGPTIQSARNLKQLADQVPPIVLVVEDDEMQHGIFEQLFAGTGFELLFATTGTEALSVLRRRKPDIVLMDVNLPDIDGIEATRRLKSVERFASIPVIMITGRSGRDVVVESMKAGASDFVVKPVERDTLLTKVRKFLQDDPSAPPSDGSGGPG
jgi:CheY-like chemotaxis protein